MTLLFDLLWKYENYIKYGCLNINHKDTYLNTYNNLYKEW